MIKQHVHEDITTDQFTLLQFVEQHQSTTASEIAQYFGVGRSAITALVNRLVEKSLLERKRNEEDRRIIYLSLTDRGKLVVIETEKQINRFLQQKLAYFDESEVEKYLVAIEKLATLVEKDEQIHK